MQNRAQLKRHPERAIHDIDALYTVVDESLVCHLGVSTSEGPLVLPMAFARIGKRVYFHGALANGIMRGGSKADHVCATFTLVDGLVFARSHFSHSMNYRCVVAFGPLREIDDPSEKQAALLAVVNHVAPGRAAVSRAPSEKELQSTRVVGLDLTMASLKVRVGPPMDGPLEENVAYTCWTGVIPLELRRGSPIPCETTADPNAAPPELPRIRSA
ncbi:MAG: pyridoxamine 5'-phosphate oxidase family protein [Polyangiaceae bacterium]